MDTDPPDHEAPGPGADEQLTGIGHVSRLLDAAGIDHWLFGGRAVDFWVGRITRAPEEAEKNGADHEALAQVTTAAD